MKNLLLLTYLFIVPLNAALPTIEGLFRHGINPDPTGEILVVRGIIEEIKSPGSESLVEEAKEENTKEETEKKSLHIKLILSTVKENRVEMLQVLYQSAEMRYADILKVSYLRNALSTKRLGSLEKSIFYSYLTMLTLNKSGPMLSNLRRIDPTILLNKDILDHEKIALLGDYKKYLIKIKEDKDLIETLENPLKPEDIDKKEAISKVLKRPLLKKSQVVKLKKIGKEFFWMINQEKFSAQFQNNTHRLNFMNFKIEDGTINYTLDGHILFDGVHELPTNTYINSIDNKKYKLRFTSLRQFNEKKNKRKSMKRRQADYLDAISKAKSKEVKFGSLDDHILPPFLFL